MATTAWVKGTLTLCNKEIPVRTGLLPQADLRFYPENPRIYSIVSVEEKEPQQGVIESRLAEMEHVKQLVQSIRANGGLTDPLIVRDRDFVVLEGNSRLAAYRLLARLDPIRWGQVKCTLLPLEIGEDMVFALLGEYHIIGKKDWAPYEQAGYLYRRNKVHGVEPARMAEEMGLSHRMVTHLIQVYSFMLEHKENDINRWSYYEEYLKHNSVKKARQTNPKLDEVVVSKINSGEIARAVDVRDKFTKIAAAGGKVLAAFVSGDRDFEESYDRAVARGADNTWYKRLNKFRRQIAEPETAQDLQGMSVDHRKKCLFELRKIKQAVESLLTKLG
jgi:hypothetical protein